MKGRICFFGHGTLIEEKGKIKSRVKDELEKLINNGYNRYLIGTHGEFDRLVLSVCRDLRQTHKNIDISVVLTSLSILNGTRASCLYKEKYEDVKTCMYPIEEEHYKKQIIISNQMMVDDSDIVICYVDFTDRKSGAKMAVDYAVKQGKEVINLFKI